jgi:hypothetical protein
MIRALRPPSVRPAKRIVRTLKPRLASSAEGAIAR